MDPSSVFKNLNTLLRHIAAGFIGIGTVWLFAGETDKCAIRALVVHHLTIAIILVAMCGLMISAIHRCLPYPLLWRLIYWIAKQTFPKLTRHGLEIINLDLKRFARRHPKDPEDAAQQQELDNWAAHIHFLYCSGWSVLGAYFYLLGWDEEPYRYAGCIMPSLTLVFIMLAAVSDWRLTCRELAIGHHRSAAGTPTESTPRRA